jgi:LAO/AO transport system kinase
MGPTRDWTPPVLSVSATTSKGIEELWDAIGEHRAYLEASGELDERRRARMLNEVESLATERLRARVRETLERDEALIGDLLDRRVDPYRAAELAAPSTMDETMDR